jgi:hypothetical protein
MRVTIRRPAPQNGAMLTNVGGQGMIEEEVDFPSRPFWTIGGITGLISAMATALVGLVTVFGVTKPDADQRRVLAEHTLHASLLERALQVQSADGRRISVNLLLATGLLKLEDAGRINEVLEGSGTDSLPHWPSSSTPRSSTTPPKQDSTPAQPTRQGS